ncbi:EAL domain-containing protein [Bacillus sp. EB600]|uniref:EAL domain-containing protein n=1 Tax=Bacillus sp. EB600 TaxID=2806345 RepID=UPI00210CBE2B|nr:EAL domain-containing protein [Bacillus sp. EB600]MCQ6280495.1 EAL domain-containing protein [Bacillus sp. EB600]
MNNCDKINILLVDDRPENLIALEAIIERDDYNLIKAYSGEEALKYLIKYDFAAILLDVQMPGIDGFGTAKIIKAREKTKNIPILFITANNMDSEHIFTGYSIGAIDYILKPFDPIILKAKVEGFVELYKMNQQLLHQAKVLEEAQEKISYMAYHDSLTDLPNRRLFNDQITIKINKARQLNQSLAILYLDMDRFKYINDSLGHIIGDLVLQKIAGKLKESVREQDFVARVGGDEFNILFPDTNRETALEIAEGIIEEFKKPIYIDHYELFITTCIGISIFPYDGEETLALMRNADAALYRAKEQGKSTFKVYHAGMNIRSYRTFIMQNDLRKAIDREELTLVYQPRIDLKSEAVRSAEALLRWNHPNWGTISPAEFIPLAEESGQIVEIGNWVLRTACKQNKAWQEAGFEPIRISVNFSAQQFLQKDLVQNIGQILAVTGVSPHLLEIEITESVILGNETIITSTLNQLKKMGVYISIDDFGTGYSSLSYLRRFPVHTLKIDRSFTKELTDTQSNGELLIAAIVSLAHNLNMSVVAEGVETEDQLNIVKKYQCEEVQGYLYSPPVSPEKFEAFLLKSQPNLSSKRKGIVYLENKKTIIRSKSSPDERKNVPEFDPALKVLDAALVRTKVLFSLSTREMDVFKLLVNGLSNKEISDELFISEHTVKNHITRIFQKLNVSDRLQAMAKVYQACIEEGGNLRA